MSKYQAYPEYKNSGVEWLGDIPTHWLTTAIKRVASFTTGMTPSTAITTYYSDDKTEFEWVRPEDIIETNQHVNASKFLTKSGWETQRVVPINSSLICCIGTIGKTGYSSKPVTTNQQITAATFSLSSKFYFYVLLAARIELEQMATGNVVQILNTERLSRLYVPLLQENDAQCIADFLDHETAKIDTLIEKQQQLIELLKEKRQAVISHAVTKGISYEGQPDVPMKDSGVEWLGEVPEHWVVGRIGYYGRVLNGSTPSKTNNNYWNSKDIPWLSSGSVNQYHIMSASDYISHKALKECSVELLPVGTLVLGMIGQGKTRGTSAVTKIEATINQNLAAIIPDHRLLSDYAHLFLQAAYNELRECARGGNQAALNCEIISDFKITVPPILEQKTIIDKVTSQLHKIDLLQNKLNSMIANSEERRTALISAAVTGKIDVRNWVAPTTSSGTNEVQQEVMS